MIGKAALCALLLGCAPILCATGALAQTSAPRPIQIGQSLQGELLAREKEPEDERGWIADYFDLRGARGETVTITLKSEDFDPFIDLDKGDEHLADDDDGGEILDSRLVYRFESDGTYRINVTSSERDETGRYTLTVARGGIVEAEDEEPQPRRASTPRDTPRPQAIRYGQTVQGSLTATSPLHEDDTPYLPYRFTGKKGEVVTIDLSAEDYDAYVILRRPGASEELAHDDDGADADGTDAKLVYTLGEDGDYEILANAISGDATGAFTLKLGQPRTAADMAREARARAMPISVGQVIRGKLDSSDARAADNSFFDLYRFSAKAGQTVVITLSSGDFDAYLAIRDAADKEIANNDDAEESSGDARLLFTPKADGEFMIEANALAAGETGDYMIGVSTQ